MNTIQKLFQQAQLAEAAYSNLWDAKLNKPITDDEEVKDALQDKQNHMTFSTAQATAFVAEWTVVDQLPDIASGFSGTLFQNKITDEYAFALRGTAGAADLMADAGDVLVDGIALYQVVDMYNYWQSLTHTGTYQAKQLTTMVAETAALQAAYLVSVNSSVNRGRTPIKNQDAEDTTYTFYGTVPYQAAA